MDLLDPSVNPDAELEIVAAPRHEVPSRFGTSSRILRASPELFVVSRIFAVISSVFGYFGVNFGHFWTNFEHFLIAFISRLWVNGSGAQ